MATQKLGKSDHSEILRKAIKDDTEGVLSARKAAQKLRIKKTKLVDQLIEKVSYD